MAKVKSVYPAGRENVYNMEVDNYHNYSVNGGFILHNCDAVRAFAVSRMVVSSKPAGERHYNFDFERPESDSGYFGTVDKSYVNYSG